MNYKVDIFRYNINVPFVLVIKMSEIVNNLDAAKAVPVLLNRIDAIKAELAELETKKSNQQPISEIQLSELEHDIAYNVADLDVLKNSVPEGNIKYGKIKESAPYVTDKLTSVDSVQISIFLLQRLRRGFKCTILLGGWRNPKIK